jgi:four helix bundle protein
MRNFRNIKAWQLADDLAVKIYEISKNFPHEELYALTSQVRRAAYSAPANIAEGAGRRTLKDYLRFLDISNGSLNEVNYFIHLSKRLEYIDGNNAKPIENLIIETSKCLNGLIRYIENEINNSNK